MATLLQCLAEYLYLPCIHVKDGSKDGMDSIVVPLLHEKRK